MALFNRNNRKGGFMDEIRCDEPNYLIWKWHPSGSQLGDNQRENSIRWGSSLRVKDGEVAVFVYKQKDGTMQDFIVGPFDQMIKTANFPVHLSRRKFTLSTSQKLFKQSLLFPSSRYMTPVSLISVYRSRFAEQSASALAIIANLSSCIV